MLTAIAQRPPRSAGAVLAAVGLLAIAGGVIAAFELLRGEQLEGVVREAPPGGTWGVDAGFGPVAVERVQRVTGAAHGAHGDAGPAERVDELRVRVAIENRLERPVPYSPGQLRLAQGGSAATTSPLDPYAGAGAIAPGQTLRREIAFVVPEGSTRFSLLIDDLIGPRPLPIRLGTVPSP